MMNKLLPDKVDDAKKWQNCRTLMETGVITMTFS